MLGELLLLMLKEYVQWIDIPQTNYHYDTFLGSIISLWPFIK